MKQIVPLPFFSPTFNFPTFISSCGKNTSTSSGCFQENKSVRLHTIARKTKVSSYKRFREEELSRSLLNVSFNLE